MQNNVVLIITSIQADAVDLQRGLAEARDGPFDHICVQSLAEALERIGCTRIDIILVDLALPDSAGLATFDRLFAAAPTVPILTLAAHAEESIAIEAIQRGAQGFLSKGHFHNTLVPQALRSIIHRRAVEAALFQEKERSRVILEAIGEAVLGTDLSGQVDYLNPVAESMTGWPLGGARGLPLAQVAYLIDGTTREVVWDHVHSAIEHDKPVQGIAGMLLVRRDGHETAVDMSVGPLHERDGKLSGAVVVLHDASASQAATFKKMTYLAEHDFLTGLPNRLMLNDRIGQAISHCARSGTGLAVLFLDLDNFKHVNDSLGHAVGDKLLQSVAQRLGACIRQSDTVSRQGGDEFIIVTTDERHAQDAAQSARKVLTEIAAPHIIDGHHLQVTTSVGISVYPDDGNDADTLVKNADTAMYHAKSQGRDNYQFFNSAMNVRAVERQTLEAHLRHALERAEFVLHYQPKVDLTSGAITGAEALLRWQHRQRGLTLPSQFVPIAEDCGLIAHIGRWVLRQACVQARRWCEDGLPPVSIAVNVSASEFHGRGFLDGVRAVLEETRVDARQLEFELTESVLMRDVEASHSTLQELKALGVRLAVDDFGTGYSSLSYLRQFPIDALKIDQSFVLDLAPHSDNGIIVAAVVGMGRNLHLRVVAEGVETRAQCRFLQEKHCDEAQGFYFSAPVNADAFAQLMRTGISARNLL
ncbi:MAG: EAL domain-containing protein [Pseudomonadota bacterium]